MLPLGRFPALLLGGGARLVGGRAPLVAATAGTTTRRGLAAKAAGEGEGENKAGSDKPQDPLAGFKELNFRLLDRNVKSVNKVASLVLQTPAEAFNHVNSASALYRLGRLLPSGTQAPAWEVTQAAAKLAGIAETHAENYGAREAARLLFGVAVGRLEKAKPQAFESLLTKISSSQEAKLKGYSIKELRQVAWSLGKIRNPTSAPLVKSIISEAQSRNLTEFTSKDITDLVWAMAQMGVKDDALLDGLAKQVLKPEALSTYEAKDVSQLMWSMAKLGYKNDTLISKLVEDVKVARGGFEAGDFALQRVSQFVWGLAVLGHKDDEILKQVISIAQDAPSNKFFSEQSVKDLEFAFWTFKSDAWTKMMDDRKQKASAESSQKATVAAERSEMLQKKAEKVKAKLAQQKAAEAESAKSSTIKASGKQ